MITDRYHLSSLLIVFLISLSLSTGIPRICSMESSILSPIELPPSRAGHNMVYDEVNHKIILFGGVQDPLDPNLESTLLGDTWSFDATTSAWKLLAPLNSPSPRGWHSMIYDSKNGKTFLFGGNNLIGRLNDLWVFDYDSNTWTELIPDKNPSSRSSSAMFYDKTNERIILFGGYGLNDLLLNDLWAYQFDNNSWFQLFNEDQPSVRYGHSMVYDEQNNLGILFAGNNFQTKMNDVWLFNCSDDLWVESNSISPPAPRYWFSMAYDSANHGSYVFGGRIGNFGLVSFGSSSESYLFEFSTNEWINISDPHSPSPRFDLPMVYDSDTQSMFLFGGYNGEQSLNDSWILYLDDTIYDWNQVNYSQVINNEITVSSKSSNSSDSELSISSVWILVIMFEIYSKLIKKRSTD